MALLAVLLVTAACMPPHWPPTHSVPSDPHQEILDEMRWQQRLLELEARRHWRDEHLWDR